MWNCIYLIPTAEYTIYNYIYTSIEVINQVMGHVTELETAWYGSEHTYSIGPYLVDVGNNLMVTGMPCSSLTTIGVWGLLALNIIYNTINIIIYIIISRVQRCNRSAELENIVEKSIGSVLSRVELSNLSITTHE